MNWAVMLVRDQAAMTQQAIDSVLGQDVPTKVFVVDNGSMNVAPLLHAYDYDDVRIISYYPQQGVAHGWNRALEYLFSNGMEHALVTNNDVVLRKDTMRLLLEDGGEFVTCIGVRGKCVGTHDGLKVFDHEGLEVFPSQPRPDIKRPHPDFSCYLIRRSAWEAVGGFDERFQGAFCEDADMHVRLHRAGIEAHCIDVPFMHLGSATIKWSQDAEAKRISAQAERNRAYFKEKWGCEVGSTEYYHGIFGHDAPADAMAQSRFVSDDEISSNITT